MPYFLSDCTYNLFHVKQTERLFVSNPPRIITNKNLNGIHKIQFKILCNIFQYHFLNQLMNQIIY